MANPYLEFVQAMSRALRRGAGIPLAPGEATGTSAPSGEAGTVVLFSPHPDDECIVGALPLRLLRERGMRVVNVSVTLGSNPVRRTARLAELETACSFLGFELLNPDPEGLEHVNATGRKEDPAGWRRKVTRIRSILEDLTPDIALFPHREDWNSTHEGTHALVMDALATMSQTFSCALVETEYWHPMYQPNLMIEADEALVADLVAGVSFHKGEVARNPYHLSLPAAMMDAVRRGSEIVGGQGQTAPQFTYASLYRVSTWHNGAAGPPPADGRIIAADEPLDLPVPQD